MCVPASSTPLMPPSNPCGSTTRSMTCQPPSNKRPEQGLKSSGSTTRPIHGRCPLPRVFRVRSVVAQAIHRFFDERGFVYVHTPIFTGSDCEGAGEMFRVTTLDMDNPPRTEDGKVDFSKDFFGKPCNLTVSGQLHGEAFALAFRDIYTFGPTFRAENSNTARHAAEFWQIEPEMAFCDLNGYMDTAEAMIKYIIKTVLERCPDEMEFFNRFMDSTLLERLNHVVNSDFVRCSYTKAVDDVGLTGGIQCLTQPLGAAGKVAGVDASALDTAIGLIPTDTNDFKEDYNYLLYRYSNGMVKSKKKHWYNFNRK